MSNTTTQKNNNTIKKILSLPSQSNQFLYFQNASYRQLKFSSCGVWCPCGMWMSTKSLSPCRVYTEGPGPKTGFIGWQSTRRIRILLTGTYISWLLRNKYAHKKQSLCYLICLRHLNRPRTVRNLFFLPENTYIFSYVRNFVVVTI